MAIYNKFLGFTVIVKVCDLKHRPIVGNFMYYEDALGFLETRMKPYERAVGCIMNAQLNHICFTKEVGPDENS